jgi:short-subunit dehydrogenase
MYGRTIGDRGFLITGASRGIGKALAEQVSRQGGRLVVAARSAGPLEELTARLSAFGREVSSVTADITCPEDRQRLLETAVRRLGRLDVVVNNAGVGSWGHFATSSEAILREVMEVNFFAPAELIRLAIPHLQRGDRPAIVNISSMCGRRGVPAWSEYSASKFALVGLTEALRGELARFDIDVLLIVPGLTRSEYFDRLLRNDGRLKIDFTAAMPPEAVAESILRSLRANRAETVLGREAKWILRVNRLLPRLVDRLMARRVRQLYAARPSG